MKHEEKINYLRIAANLCSFGFTNDQLDLLISLYELVLDKKGNSAIDDVARIEVAVKKRAEAEKKKELEKTVSKK